MSPPTISSVRAWQYEENAPVLNIGEEMGRFNMGSTIIVLFGQDAAAWSNDFTADKVVKMGEQIGSVLR